MEKHGRKLKKKFKIMLVIVAILLIGIATLLGLSVILNLQFLMIKKK